MLNRLSASLYFGWDLIGLILNLYSTEEDVILLHYIFFRRLE